MEHFKRYHALGTFLFYVVIVNLKTSTNYIDALVLGLLFAYTVVSIISTHKHTPDIRKEIYGAIRAYEDLFNVEIKKLAETHRTEMKVVEKDVTDIKAKIATATSAKTIGMSNARF